MNGVPVRRRTSHGFSRSSLRRPTSQSLITIPDTASPGRSGALSRRPVTSGSGAPEAAQEAPRCSCWADTLLWPRQLNELTVLRRVLNRRRPKGAGERITENTLVRLAVDLLLANAGQLEGSTEDELRRSLGLGD